MNNKEFSPVVLFVYARPAHTRRTLNALALNLLAEQTKLIVFSDGARDDTDLPLVEEVRAIVRAARGFSDVELVEREGNRGLARNIIDGVSEVCRLYGRVIVLEDDIETAPHFLTFMNSALDRYELKPKVWHVSGWSYPIITEGLKDAFFYPVMDCWGWATWADRWEQFEKEPLTLIARWDAQAINRFNLNGAHDFWLQVRRNATGLMNTWAVFWYATIFEHNGLCLNPSRSYVRNIGIDGSGQNSGSRNIFDGGLMERPPTDWPMELAVDMQALTRIQDFLRATRPSFVRRMASRIKWVTRNLYLKASRAK
jgi:hypothetical protein